jgi:catechol 2,3-dioxygenase-like lactoylglutathione lyase family enzyme
MHAVSPVPALEQSDLGREAMPFTPLGLDHIVLRVRDQEAAMNFYIDVLGAALDFINTKISLIQLRFGEHMIDLFPGGGAGERSADTGIDHFCLSIRCDDLAALATELRAKGAAVDGEIVNRLGAYGDGPSLYLHDLDGYRVELKPR